MAAVVPRSTWIHCGSANPLDQRVPVSPSTAAEAGVAAFSTEEAVTGFPCDNRALAAVAGVNEAVVNPATSASTAVTTTTGQP